MKKSCLKPQGLKPWYEASPSEPLPSSNYIRGARNGPPLGSQVFIGLYRESHWKNLLVQNHKAYSFYYWYVASPSGPLPSFSNYPPGAKKGSIPGVKIYIGLFGENHEKILSETTRPRALIFGMKHHIVTLYQICSNYFAWVKNGPSPGITCFTLAYIGKNLKKSRLKSYGIGPWYLACIIT